MLFRSHKKLGGVVAGIASMVPSILIILIIALFLENILAYPLVTNMFAMIRIVVTALIINTAITLGQKGIKDMKGILIFAVSFVMITFLDISPIYIVILAMLAGILLYPRQVKP